MSDPCSVNLFLIFPYWDVWNNEVYPERKSQIKATQWQTGSEGKWVKKIIEKVAERKNKS